MPSTVPSGNYNACMVIGKGNPTRNWEHHMNSNAGVSREVTYIRRR